MTKKIILVLDIALKSSPSRWWDTHKIALSLWEEFKFDIQHHFLPFIKVKSLGQEKKHKSLMLSLEIYDG